VPSRKQQASSGYLEKRQARVHKRQPHAQAPRPPQWRPSLHGVADGMGYEVVVAADGFEGDDVIGAICTAITIQASAGEPPSQPCEPI